MELTHAPDLHPAFLQPGMLVGPWRVVSRQGRATNGVVYRAERDGEGPEGLVSLRIAVTERDERYGRERELLSRLHHPSIPRLKDHGAWESPAGSAYPYLVVEWVEGVPIYEWAATHDPSLNQVLRLLAQVAGALAAMHAAGGVHRDIKGDNVLVEKGGERAVLTDLGAGQGRQPKAHPVSQPSDDVLALGVMAYRLVTKQALPPTEPGMDGSEEDPVEGETLRSPRELNPRVTPRLDALISRMLSVDPKARGTARELAEALEQAAESMSPDASAPPFAEVQREVGEGLRLDRLELEAQRCALARTQQLTSQSPPPPLERKRWLWLSLAALAVVVPLALQSPRFESSATESLEPPLLVHAEAFDGGRRDAGMVDLGDGVLTSSVPVGPPTMYRGLYGPQIPRSPLPGQRRPPCMRTREIRGGCWMKYDARPPDCPEIAYEWRGGCYVPVLSKPRSSTADD